jgi:hypothetical protein
VIDFLERLIELDGPDQEFPRWRLFEEFRTRPGRP